MGFHFIPILNINIYTFIVNQLINNKIMINSNKISVLTIKYPSNRWVVNVYSELMLFYLVEFICYVCID